MPGRRRAFRPADGPSGPDPAHREKAPAGAEPVSSRDENAVGWGDERDEPSAEADISRLLADRPPHHDRT